MNDMKKGGRNDFVVVDREKKKKKMRYADPSDTEKGRKMVNGWCIFNKSLLNAQ